MHSRPPPHRRIQRDTVVVPGLETFDPSVGFTKRVHRPDQRRDEEENERERDEAAELCGTLLLIMRGLLVIGQGCLPRALKGIPGSGTNSASGYS
jgi:hypothetical protein